MMFLRFYSLAITPETKLTISATASKSKAEENTAASWLSAAPSKVKWPPGTF
jgi:hypothetical protein